MKIGVFALMFFVANIGHSETNSRLDKVLFDELTKQNYVSESDIGSVLESKGYTKVTELVPQGNDGVTSGPFGSTTAEVRFYVELFNKSGEVFCPKNIFKDYLQYLKSNDSSAKAKCIVVEVKEKTLKESIVRPLTEDEDTIY